MLNKFNIDKKYISDKMKNWKKIKENITLLMQLAPLAFRQFYSSNQEQVLGTSVLESFLQTNKDVPLFMWLRSLCLDLTL